MHGDIVELTEHLGRQTWIIWYMRINFFVCCGSNLYIQNSIHLFILRLEPLLKSPTCLLKQKSNNLAFK